MVKGIRGGKKINKNLGIKNIKIIKIRKSRTRERKGLGTRSRDRAPLLKLKLVLDPLLQLHQH